MDLSFQRYQFEDPELIDELVSQNLLQTDFSSFEFLFNHIHPNYTHPSLSINTITTDLYPEEDDEDDTDEDDDTDEFDALEDDDEDGIDFTNMEVYVHDLEDPEKLNKRSSAYPSMRLVQGNVPLSTLYSTDKHRVGQKKTSFQQSRVRLKGNKHALDEKATILNNRRFQFSDFEKVAYKSKMPTWVQKYSRKKRSKLRDAFLNNTSLEMAAGRDFWGSFFDFSNYSLLHEFFTTNRHKFPYRFSANIDWGSIFATLPAIQAACFALLFPFTFEQYFF